MATIYYKIFKHHKKKDGRYNIKYCLTHKGKQVYHSSTHFASDGQLKKDLTIKDRDLLRRVDADIVKIETRLSDIGIRISSIPAKELLEMVTTDDNVVSIDFIAFSRGHLERLRSEGREGTANSMRPAINNLVDYLKKESIDIKDVTSQMLRGFEAFLKTKRKQIRINQLGEEVVTVKPALGQSGVHNNMRTLRILFNECRRAYNTEFRTVITHYPFDFYKIPSPAGPRKKGSDINIEDIRAIRDIAARPLSRKEVARDMFMLSFYLCGMNAKDIYDHEWVIRNGRIEYDRSKTESRSGGSFISVAVPAEAMQILDKYHKKFMHRRYGTHGSLLTAISKGMEQVSQSIGKKVTFYHARHTFATLARNRCGFSKDDIAETLNHASSHKVTDRYIAEDWSVVDKVQKGVLDLLARNDPI